MANLPFHAIIKPVGDICNLNCSYCFYKEKSGQGSVMSLEVLEAVTKKYINEQPKQCKEVQFVWQGGEPMMAGIEFYQTALELQERYRREGMAITNAIQINGMLINQHWVDFFKQHNFLVGISIDGPYDIHDAKRVTSSGKGSHARVLSGYRLLQQHGIQTNVLCVVHKNNVLSGADLYSYFVEELDARSIQFLPVVGDETIDAKHWGNFLTQTFDAWLDNGLGRVSVQLFDASFARIVQGIESFCVHSYECGRQLAVERNGDVFSCDHYVDSKHHIGNVLSHSFESMLDSQRQRDFARQSTKHDEVCSGCEVKGLCQSGCPKHRDVVGKNRLCEGYYRFFTYSMTYNYAIAESLRRGMGVASYKKFLPQIEVQIREALSN